MVDASSSVMAPASCPSARIGTTNAGVSSKQRPSDAQAFGISTATRLVN